MAKKAKQTSITGRDGYIVNQALLYAISHIQSLPAEKQEWSNMRDMCLIVRTNMSFFTMDQVRGVDWHTGREMTLWPEPDNELSIEDRQERDTFKAELRRQKDEVARFHQMQQQGNPDFIEMTAEDVASIRGAR